VRICVDCGADNRFPGSVRCRACYDARRKAGPVGACTRCAKRRPIYDSGGRCDFCVYVGRPRPVVVAPPCVVCGEKRRIIAHGNCRRCLVNNPETTRTFAEGLARRLGPGRPPWYYAFVTHVVERYSPSEARGRLRELGRLLAVTADPPALVAAATHKDGRLAPLGRALDEFFGSLLDGNGRKMLGSSPSALVRKPTCLLCPRGARGRPRASGPVGFPGTVGDDLVFGRWLVRGAHRHRDRPCGGRPHRGRDQGRVRRGGRGGGHSRLVAVGGQVGLFPGRPGDARRCRGPFRLGTNRKGGPDHGHQASGGLVPREAQGPWG
jgi:hypothetical protein